jgi:5'(3')-deoxyribonucleotidase
MKIVYIDMDDVIVNYSKAWDAEKELNPLVRYPQSRWGFFANLEPIEGAIDACFALLGSKEYDPYILTAPSVYNALCYTEKRVSVAKYLGIQYVERLIICPHKNLCRGDYLIDDNITGKGQDKFEGELMHFGSNEYPTWAEVRKRLNV